MTDANETSSAAPVGPLRLVVALIMGAVCVWLLAGWWRQQRERAQGDVAKRPEASLPDYDCPDQRVPSENSGAVRVNGRFTDVADSLGIDFKHIVGPLGTWFMPESIGAGVAVLDYDADGRMDLYFVNCGPTPDTSEPLPPGIDFRNRLYRQTESGGFVDVTTESGLGDEGYGAGVAVGDVDNDGYPDMFIANYGRDALYRNTGSGRFEVVSDGPGGNETDWGAAAAFVDYDRDGWLDLLIVNYTADPVYGHRVSCGFSHGLVSYCGPHKFQATVDRLYRNETGDRRRSGVVDGKVSFRDVTEECGLSVAKTFGFGAVCTDLTGDGWADLFIANDGAPNRLWVNQSGRGFLEEAAARGAACNSRGMSEAGMGAAWGMSTVIRWRICL